MQKVTIEYKPYTDGFATTDPDTHDNLAQGGMHFHVYYFGQLRGVYVMVSSVTQMVGSLLTAMVQ